jgi:hypothetical protein
MLALRQGLVDPSHPVQWPGSEPARAVAAPGPTLDAASPYPA